MNAKTTKTARKPSRKAARRDDLDREYRFDYADSGRNRFARRFRHDAVVVVLDADVARVFGDPKRVNAFLRATIAALKTGGPRRAG